MLAGGTRGRHREIGEMMKSTWKSFCWGSAIIVAMTVVAYIPALRGGFIWDDDDHLTKNPAMVSVDGLKRIWSSLESSRYYPLTLTSFWLQRRLWGLNPLPYHAFNIALHAINAVLLWKILSRLEARGAWIAAAIWAVHPVNVETVAWITELKNAQSGLFFLLAMLLFMKFEDKGRGRDYAISLLCGLAAMLSKPSTVVLPGVLLLCIWWRHRRWTWKDLSRVTPLIAFAAGMSALTIVEQRHHIERGIASESALTVAQRVLLAGDVVWFYAGKLIWPVNVCFIYPRWELPVDSVVAWLPLVGLVIVAVGLWQFRRDRWARALTFGLGFFIIALLPVLGFFDIYFFRYTFVADHFQYLPSIGLIALGAAGLEFASQRSRNFGTLAVIIVLFGLGVGSWRQAHVYRDLESLWRDTLKKNPNAWMAHNNLGATLAARGNVPDAITEFQASLRINPNNVEAHNNLAAALVRQGRLQEAIGHWELVLQIKPDFAEVHSDLAAALMQAGKLDAAVQHYQRALKMKPDIPEAHNNLGIALVRLNREQEAVTQFEQAIQIKPNYADAHFNLGILLEQAGKVQEAIAQYEWVLRIDPNMVEAQNRLARLRAAR